MNQQKSSKKKIIWSSTVVLVVLLVFTFLELTGTTHLTFLSRWHDKKAQKNEGGINYGPPTKEEKQAGDKQKETNSQKEQQQNSQQEQGAGQSEARTVHVTITDAAQYGNTIEVRSFIPDYYEDGTCTITFKKDSFLVTKDTPAYRDATTTICTNPVFARSEFPVGGKWQVTVSYTSNGAKGQSATQEVVIN